MFLSLHNRSAHSFGSSLTTSGQLMEFAVRHGMSAIALTDLHGLYGAVAFQQACEKGGIRPVIGAELMLRDGPAVTMLVGNSVGYGHLCRLVSTHHLREEPLGIADLCAHAEGLWCLLGSGQRSAVSGQQEGREGADGTLRTMLNSDAVREAFVGRLYVELAIHHPDDAAEARRRGCAADEAGVPVVATCESRCPRPEMNPILRALASIGTLTLLGVPHADKPLGRWHLRTPAEMERLFRRRPDALTNTAAIAEQCDFRFDFSSNRFPAFDAPDGKTAVRYLRELCVAGCRRRYVDELPQRGIGGRRPSMAEALSRLDRELAVIEQVGYAEYFLVFHEIVSYCRGRGIATLARGSAADSLVCYALGVSHACPFRFDLPFDRFLNPERAKFSKMADIDLDLPWDRREEVMRWVYERWGHDQVAMIGSANTYRARAAVAELGKVYGLPPHEIHKFTRRLPWFGRVADLDAGGEEEQHEAGAIGGGPPPRRQEERHRAISRPGNAQLEEPYRTILRTAGALEGLPHHWSMHPCGLVVSPESLIALVPVQRSPRGLLVAQYDMDAIEDLGFIKIDLLGQAGLSVLRDSVAEINRTEREPIDLATDVDYSDDRTWSMIAGGGARGVHHIESPAMTSLIRQCNCRDIDALTAIVAIIRPGAANQGKKDRFARRYQGLEPASYVHPSVRNSLASTYGLMVFEEHILQVAVDFAGMNLGRADVLRRALNKQKRDLVAELKGEFRNGARRMGRREDEIAAVWDMVGGFCGFMFNKAHSAEYAVEAFQGAWLKCRWPAHYLAAILSNYRGFYAQSPTLPQILYVLEALRLGVGFRPPCVNRSGQRFRVERNESDGRWVIRVPLSHIQGLSEAWLDRYHGERERGVFTDLADFIERCRPGDAESQLLLDSGALDALGENRPAMFWQMRRLLKESRRVGGLFAAHPRRGDSPVDLPSSDRRPPGLPTRLTCPDAWQTAQREMELLGFPITIEPLTFLSRDDKGRHIDWPRYAPVSELSVHSRRRVAVCGLMVADRLNTTPAGEMMKFVTLADRTGFVEAILFPDTYRHFGHLTVSQPILAATGVVERFENGNGFAFRVERVEPPRRVG
ncbi:MAG TPA: DNA polymerase III subunit alpha [Phycisphaerae bacterium]|nr:DNA polymerase III subunit alpha [Phycisphaerae bacterium]HRY69924.1 DNA polymerase III subunit alpha [Phycisphaerae bacterium]HSA27133.1 DNA polymerase III subunit alpha [Phycisphaerae bacterium]